MMRKGLDDIADLLAVLAHRGISIEAKKGNLHLRPRRRLTAALIGRLLTHKAQIISTLTGDVVDEERATWPGSLPLSDRLRYDRAYGRAWFEDRTSRECHMRACMAVAAHRAAKKN
jgi:hypothetical protein